MCRCMSKLIMLGKQIEYDKRWGLWALEVECVNLVNLFKAKHVCQVSHHIPNRMILIGEHGS